VSSSIENYLAMLLVKLGKYEENAQQRQGGVKADKPFARVDCSVILREMHLLLEKMPLKQDTKVCSGAVPCCHVAVRPITPSCVWVLLSGARREASCSGQVGSARPRQRARRGVGARHG
jgi:hypothetical protein